MLKFKPNLSPYAYDYFNKLLFEAQEKVCSSRISKEF